MLCIGRRVGEEVIITIPPSAEKREIRVMLVESQAHKARLGFVADRDIVIDRDEIHARKHAKTEAA